MVLARSTIARVVGVPAVVVQWCAVQLRVSGVIVSVALRPRSTSLNLTGNLSPSAVVTGRPMWSFGTPVTRIERHWANAE